MGQLVEGTSLIVNKECLVIMRDEDDTRYSKKASLEDNSYEIIMSMFKDVDSDIDDGEIKDSLEDLLEYWVKTLYIITSDLNIHVIKEDGYAEIDSWKWTDEEWLENMSTLEGLVEEGW